MVQTSVRPRSVHADASACQAAVGPLARQLLQGIHAPFVDFESLVQAILPQAEAAGWHENVVRSALRATVAGLQVEASGRGNGEAADTLSRTTSRR